MADQTVTTTSTTSTSGGVTATSSQTQIQSNDGTSAQGGFCGTEERVSTHTCNSLHPATTLDQFGNQAIAWNDNRDGNYEIYFRLYPSKMSSSEQEQVAQLQENAQGRPSNLACSDIDQKKFADGEDSSGFSGVSFALTQRCSTLSGTSGVSGVLVRYSSGRLDVSQVAQTIFLTAATGTDFVAVGLLPGDTITFDTGKNAGINLIVSEVIGPQLAKLNFDPKAIADTGFIYSVIKGAVLPQETCETRLTCDRGASMFPDVLSDKACRYHVVYHDDKTGDKQIYYVQVAPGGLLNKGCGKGPINVSSFGEVSSTTRGAFRYFSDSPPTVRYFKRTGAAGSFFSFGNKLLPEPDANMSGSSSTRTGKHSVFRDFEFNGGKWVGITKKQDRDTWEEQIASNPVAPDVVYSDVTALVEPGDFGGAFSFKDIAIMVQSPPDMDLDVRTIAIPLIPKCAPQSPAQSLSKPRESDLVEAPKRPLPPTFVDPVDLTSFLSSPMVTIRGDEPSRFTLEGDDSGTIFTNIVVEDASGDLQRLLFRKDTDGSLYKFVLGLSNCNGSPCAVKASRPGAKDALKDVEDGRYKVTLQVWKGSDYRIDPTQVDSASMLSEKIYDKDFYFDANDNLTTFAIAPNQLKLEAGHVYFIVPIASESTEFMLRGVGGGSVLWTLSDASGEMTQYNVPFTVPPYKGLTMPAYYDGILMSPPPPPLVIDKIDKNNIMLLEQDPNVGTGTLVPLNIPFNSPIGVDYNPVTNKLVVSSNYPTGRPNSLQQISEDGTVAPFTNLSGMGDELMLAIMREVLPGSGWTEGDVVFGNGAGGQLVKASADGTSVINPWVSLPTNGLFRGGVYFDRTGVFGGDLVAATTWGSGSAPSVWRIKSDGSFSKLCNIGAKHLEGILTIPDDTSKYGPWAGKIIVGAEIDHAMFTVDVAGAVEKYPLPINPEQMAICEEGTNLYAVAFTDRAIYAMAAADLVDSVGNIFIAQEFPGNIYELRWNGSKFVTSLVAATTQLEQINFSEARITPLNAEPPPDETGGPCGTGELKATYPKLITQSPGVNVYPRLAGGPTGVMWSVWHSTRDGSEEIYAGRYFGDCNAWNASGTGGDDMRVTSFASEGHRAMFPSVAVSQTGEAHVVFQGTSDDNKFEIFYTRTTGAGSRFLPPIRLTNSPNEAAVPDIAISYEDGIEKVTVTWHDNRFGQFEIMSASKYLGKWRSSYQGGSDIRVTNSAGDSMFPRLAADKDGNIRCVYHSTRTGRNEIFMSTYVGLTRSWSSSGQGGQDQKVSNGPLNSLFPDVATDSSGGVALAWHDDRNTIENPDVKEEIYRTYCPKLGQPGECFPPIVTNVEERLDVQFDVVDCVSFQPVDLTNVPEVCLRIKSPGATFWRAVNNDAGANKQWSNWQQFKPSYDLDTTVVPWTLSCSSGPKEVCVQVQDSSVVGFPICKQVILAIPPQDYKVEFFADELLTTPLPSFEARPAAREGDIFVKITAPTPQVLPPKFTVVGKGGHIAVNQETMPIFGSLTGVSGFADANQTARTTDNAAPISPSQQDNAAILNTDMTSGATSTSLGTGSSGASGVSGIGSFSGQNFSGTFSAAAAQEFVGRFHVFKDDGLFHMDGLARVIVQPQGLCPNTPASADTQPKTDECPGETTVPPGAVAPTFLGTSGFSSPSGTSGPWNAGSASAWMTIDLTSNDVVVVPEINAIPYKLTIGAIAQPFTVPVNISGDVTIMMKLAKREVPEWLSSFSSRRVLVQLLADFFTLTPTVVAAAYVPAGDLPTVKFDPVTGLMIDPTSLAFADTVSVTLSGVGTLLSGTDYAISVQDDTFYPLLGTYGANAKFFVFGVGTDVFSGAQPYYFRDY